MRRFFIAIILFFCSSHLHSQNVASRNETDIISLFTDSATFNYFSDVVAKKGTHSLVKSEIFSEKQLKSAETSGNQKGVAAACSNLAWIRLRDEDYKKALEYFDRALKAFELSKNGKAAAATNAEIGFVYQLMKDNDNALMYYTTAFQRMKQLQMNKGIAITGSLLGQLHSAKKKHAKALEYFLEAEKNFSSDDAKSLAPLKIKIAEEYVIEGKDDSAIPYLNAAVKFENDLNDATGKASALRDLGIIYFRKADYEKALQYFQQSSHASDRLSVLKLIRDTYLKLLSASEVKKDAQKSKDYKSLYNLYNDSVQALLGSRSLSPDSFARELSEKDNISEMLTHHKDEKATEADIPQLELNQKMTVAELERLKTEKEMAEFYQAKKQDEIADHEREDKIQQLMQEKALQDLALSQRELKDSRQRQLIYLLIGGLAAILISFGFTYYRYRTKRKSHRELDKAYNELSDTLDQLKATQAQLVHQEKLASLGQLTAGIAHEIQNPLNFVNNFSEVSEDLINELLQTKDENERKEILNDLQSNLQKINHHGKRADSIVKNMLRHSRTDTQEKQPTDINKLCNEFFLIAYHGMKAKDTAFNCRLEKKFDTNLPLISVVPQEISRIIINLCGNAFYAVKEKKEKLAQAHASDHYQPTVSLSTAKQNGSVIISVADNGTGIPQHLIEKIFNPFFTTKPTGEGTGLGLSMSYDIIKAHGGTMEVKSNPGEGTEFIIAIPNGE